MSLSLPRERLRALDALRGLALFLAALSLIAQTFYAPPSPPTGAGATAQMTLLIGQFAPSIFVFLAGIAVALHMARRHRTPGAMAPYLAARAGLFVLLQMTLVTVLREGDPLPTTFHLTLPWALAAGYLVMVGMVWLPGWLVGALASLLLIAHPLLQPLIPDAGALTTGAQQVLFDGGMLTFGGSHQAPLNLHAHEPLIPWLAVMMLGFGTARLFAEPNGVARTRGYLLLGAAFLVALLLCRLWDGLGYPDVVALAQSPSDLLDAFVTMGRAPITRDFILLTLAPLPFLIALYDRLDGRLTAALAFYGRGALPGYLALLILVLGGEWLAVAFGVSASLDQIYWVWASAIALLVAIALPVGARAIGR